MGADDVAAGAALEPLLGYRFRDRALLQNALTNPSYKSDHQGERGVRDNQRLEFLGDAVLGLLAAERVFLDNREAQEGPLTTRRSRLVSGAALARAARGIGLGRFLVLGKSENNTRGRDRENCLADTMEAIFGAAWCDGGLDAARLIFSTLAIGNEPDPAAGGFFSDNPKGALQEYCQERRWGAPAYTTVSATGPDHAPTYTVSVSTAGGTAQGSGHSKRTAETAAALALLRSLHCAAKNESEPPCES